MPDSDSPKPIVSEDDFEQAYVNSVKKQNTAKSAQGSLVGGTLAGIGTFFLAANPLFVAPAAVIGGVGAYKYYSDRGKKHLKKTQRILGEEISQNEENHSINNNSSKPDVRRLKFLISWAKLQIDEDFSSDGRLNYSTRFNCEDVEQMSKLRHKVLRKHLKIIEGVVASFTPWLQYKYLYCKTHDTINYSSSNSHVDVDDVQVSNGDSWTSTNWSYFTNVNVFNGDENDVQTELSHIRLHLSQLCKFLAMYENVSTSFFLIHQEIVTKYTNVEDIVYICKNIYKPILEIINFVCEQRSSNRSIRKSSKLSSISTRKLSNNIDIYYPELTHSAIVDFLRLKRTCDALSDDLMSGGVLGKRHHNSIIEDNSDLKEETDEETIAVMEEGDVEFPPLGVEREVSELVMDYASDGGISTTSRRRRRFKSSRKEAEEDNNDFFSASEGDDEEFNESIRAPLPSFLQRPVKKKTTSISRHPSPLEDPWISFTNLPSFPPNTWGNQVSLNVRGKSYLTDRLKIDSGFSHLLEAIEIDSFYSEVKVSCASKTVGTKAHYLLNYSMKHSNYFFIVINFSFCPNQVCMIMAYDKNKLDLETSSELKLLKKFIEADEDLKKETLKVIPRVVDGPWIAKKAVGQTPTLIGRKLDTNFHYEPDRYIEVEIDVFSSVAARTMMGILQGACKRLVIDVGFVFEAKITEDLPEQLLAAFQVRKVDIRTVRALD